MKKTSLRKKTILVIEDERVLLDVVNARLEKKGFNVIAARSVDEVFNATLEKNDLGIISARNIKHALEYLENLRDIDAIWLDHNLLGKENGLDFVKKFQSNSGRLKGVPIFVVSNSEGKETIDSYINLGISKYYVKSNHKLDEIIDDINKAFEDKK